MLGIMILNKHPSGSTQATYCPPTTYRSRFYQSCEPNLYQPYGNLASGPIGCYASRRYCYLPGIGSFYSPQAHRDLSSCGFTRYRAYKLLPGRSCCVSNSYGPLASGSQAYWEPWGLGYFPRGPQRIDDPYGYRYLYSYRKGYLNPWDYGYLPSYSRRCFIPYGYSKQYYPSSSYSYRSGYSSDPCGYSCAPGYCQPCYAERRRYSSRPLCNVPYACSSSSLYSSGY